MVNAQSLYPALAPYGFESTGNICYGSWRNYAVSILPPQSSIIQLVFAVRADKNDKALDKALRTELRQQLGKGFSSKLYQDRCVFGIRFKGKTPLEQQFVQVADTIAATLSAHGLHPANTCAVCGGGTPESLCVVNTYQPVHAACMRQKVETIREHAEDNKENGSYLTGLVGALLGGLVGAILPLVLILATNTISAFLYALIPLAAMFGYRKFKGKSDKISIVIVVLVSLLFVALIDLVYLAYQFMDYFNCSFGQGISFALNNLDAMDGGDIAKTFLFMALGLVVSWGYLSKTGTAEVKTATTLMGTLRPNPMFAQDYSQEAEPVYGQEAESVYSQAEEAAPSQPRQTLYWNGQNKGE